MKNQLFNLYKKNSLPKLQKYPMIVVALLKHINIHPIIGWAYVNNTNLLLGNMYLFLRILNCFINFQEDFYTIFIS